MDNFCQDRDLLGVEPRVFLDGGFPSQQLIAGGDGNLSGTTFTSATSDFQSAGLGAGMVLTTYTASAAEGNALEIVSVDSATSLTVSVLRADAESAAVAPPAGTGLNFHVRTFSPQIRGTSATLAEKLRQMIEVGGICAADFADSAQLRRTTCYGALSGIFVARAENAAPFDANWIKAEHYRIFVRDDHLRFGGIKLFFKHDPNMLQPADVLGLDPSPDIVIYQ